MILCQKQPQLPLNPPSAHRRHPSAPPAVVVQPTRTPGLLSLSKPLRPSPQRHQQQQRQRPTPKSKHVLHHIGSPQPVPGQSQISDRAVPKSVEAADNKHIPPQMTPNSLSSPEKSVRGRQQAKLAKDKTARSISASSSRGFPRRNNARQPSPPIQSNSHTEGQSSSPPNNQSFSHKDRNPASNPFDPFLVNSASDTESGSDSAQPQSAPKPALRPAPTLSAHPSGKLARRRQHMPGTPTPAPSKAVPVPRSNRHHANHMNLSRSDPVLSHMPARHINGRPAMTAPAAAAQWDAFPICDDMTDAGMTPPATPVRGKSAKAGAMTFDDGPSTAPLARTTAFPFGGFSTPSPTPRGRGHQRTPSEGVFNMSFNEDSDSSEGLKALFELRKRVPSGNNSVRLSNKDKAGYFASSMFQNSPSPEELPPPSF